MCPLLQSYFFTPGDRYFFHSRDQFSGEQIPRMLDRREGGP